LTGYIKQQHPREKKNMKALLSTTTRKSIYGVVIALNGLLGVLIPVLVSQGVIEASVAATIAQIAASVVAVFGSIVAIRFVPDASE
jgi:hypothetical protein